jgi:DNA-binding transcriptional ArsR family regulator
VTEPDPDSPLAAVGGDAARAAEAFAVLSDETRLAILLALWEAYDPDDPDRGVSFSALREALNDPDSGGFSYHLGKLQDRFVRETEDGYALSLVGLQFAQAVVGGAGIKEPSLGRTDVDLPCRTCGGDQTVEYAQGRLVLRCTECEGYYDSLGGFSEGLNAVLPFSPAGLVGRTPEEVWTAAMSASQARLTAATWGVCPECTGVVERRLLVCDDHDPGGGNCAACGRGSRTAASFVCTVCKNLELAPVSSVVFLHPAVWSFFHERGVDIRPRASDLDSVRQWNRLSANREHVVASADPPRVRVTVECDGDAVHVTVDADLEVVAVEAVE